MLVLTRKENEAIALPGLGVKITVAKTKGNAVRLAIEAPPEIAIMRSELLDRDVVEGSSQARPGDRSGGEVCERHASYRCGERTRQVA